MLVPSLTPVQFFFEGMAGAVNRRNNGKGAAALDPLTRFGGTSDGMKIVMAFEKADPALRRMLAQHVADVVRLARTSRRRKDSINRSSNSSISVSRSQLGASTARQTLGTKRDGKRW